MNLAPSVVRLKHFQVEDSKYGNAIDCKMWWWKKEANQRWYNDGNKSTWLLFETHHWICDWHGMVEETDGCD